MSVGYNDWSATCDPGDLVEATVLKIGIRRKGNLDSPVWIQAGDRLMFVRRLGEFETLMLHSNGVLVSVRNNAIFRKLT